MGLRRIHVDEDGTQTILEEFDSDTSEIHNVLTPEEQEALWSKLKRLELTHYRQARGGGYPSIGDQLDDLFKQGVFSDDMTAKIQAVKDAHPKPTDA